LNCGEGGVIACVDALSDADNCGWCESKCSADAWCENGTCTVQGGEDDLGEE
jgi:hypothetical protein